MKSIIGLTLGLGMSFLVNAQSIPTLAKVYAGSTAETSINSSQKNPKIQTQKEAATLTILKQDGQHVEFTYQNPAYKAYEIGTISADGKKLQIAYKGGSGVYDIVDNKLVGCGSGRVNEGPFGKWINTYYAWCDDLTAK
ncbi:hypothetical protein [Polynucleobacter sp. AP-Latsch-80-C2]|jgi:hypothetical protein|uniref:hypothetical protein n=1 Tax=Polynucleobacter sp. AP-Latsch-80-C2 TaxID=2576931 RepID=UPI001C0C73CD|nr:hypothetical protein [Polynucleobacter sp. AP-Latsch-80-C2]MBU3622313.1 hypothetical protein [Polynucleobacter sp. AP-Latsch-80-C2]